MNRWSSNRKRIIFLIIFLAALILIGVPAFFFIYKAPTCFDSKQNGDETGVDCGGSCQLLCAVESLPIIQKGDARILKVANNVYEVVALFENPNASAQIYRASYTIRLFSASSTAPVKIIEGEVFVPQNGLFAVFEKPFLLENESPSKAVFSWKEESLIWQKNNVSLPNISVRTKNLTKPESAPRLDIQVLNNSLETIYNIELIVLLSDAEGNIFAASKTFLDYLSPGILAPAVFTWPAPFEKQTALIDVIPRILPDKSFIR